MTEQQKRLLLRACDNVILASSTLSSIARNDAGTDKAYYLTLAELLTTIAASIQSTIAREREIRQ